MRFFALLVRPDRRAQKLLREEKVALRADPVARPESRTLPAAVIAIAAILIFGCDRYASAQTPQAKTVKQAQFQTTVQPESVPVPNGLRVRIMPRSGIAPRFESRQDVAGNNLAIFDGGVKILIEGLPSYGGALDVSGTVDIETDRLVVWSSAPVGLGETVHQANTPIELYMEGNIVFRQGDRVVQAQAMYYNTNLEYGVILDAELLSAIPRYEGLVRLKSQVLRQLDRDHFVAENASLTTSRLGIPTYEFKSGVLTFEDRQVPAINPFTGQPEINPQTGAPLVDHQQLVTGENNVLLLDEVPVFYWPWFAADLQRPPLYVDSIAYRHDSVFGNQILIDLNPYQILGIRKKPAGTDWTASLD